MSTIHPATDNVREKIPDTDRYDPDGNVVIVVQGQSPHPTRRFLVSSKVLSLVSPVFAGLFSPRFFEGRELEKCACPELTLHDDEPRTMGIIFAILHYHEPKELAHMNAGSLAVLAIHCDKYDCGKAFWPWVSIWFQILQSKPTEEDYGHLLLAAHFFRNPEHFSEISRKAQLELPFGFNIEWEKSELLDMIPDVAKCKLYQISLAAMSYKT